VFFVYPNLSLDFLLLKAPKGLRQCNSKIIQGLCFFNLRNALSILDNWFSLRFYQAADKF